MIRSSKTLGLALFAVFAMSALLASAARAGSADFAASKYPAHIVAFPDGGLTYTTALGQFTCVTVGESGPMEGTASLNTESSDLTLESIAYTNCHATVLQLPVTVDMNGCSFTFTAGTMVNATTAEGSVHIICPEIGGVRQEITITVFANKAQHWEGTPGCVFHVPEQTPSAGVIKYTNLTTASGQKTVTVSIVNNTIYSSRTEGTLCAAKATELSTYKSSFIAEATEGVSVEITGTP